MAGYFVVLSDIVENNHIIKKAKDILKEMYQSGMYSTIVHLQNNTIDGTWAKPKEATFADYFGMRAGDLIFFFFDRKIYGVGRLVNVGRDCKYWGYAGANNPIVYSENDIETTRLTDTILPQNRCVCFFEPVEYYCYAVDMDEALMAYPSSFKSLRVIQNRSFIKMDDEEAIALLAVLKRRNEMVSQGETPDIQPVRFDRSKHDLVLQKIGASRCYDFTSGSLLQNYPIWNSDGIQHEMMIEAALMECLTKQSSNAFDELDYFSHQVAASPAKPVEYMEWIDVYGYSISRSLTALGIPTQFAIEKYYVIEIKRDGLTLPRPRFGKQEKAVANQLMKYVDWVAKNHANGAYPMVKGIIVANAFDEAYISYCKKVCLRNFNDGYRDAIPSEWNDFELVKYSYDGTSISFEKVYPEQ